MTFRQVFVSRLALACACAALAACGGGPAKQAARAPARATTPAPAPTPTPIQEPGVATVDLVEDPLDVPFVPTPQGVVDRMLEMAKVKADDVVYDLGSGDGRIVITAAKRYGARGVGYDLNPRRINESNRNASEAGVTERVRFEQADLFEVDLSGATVVTLYLLPDVNMKLRPKLLALKPGTRVVSHNYHMGDWEPLERAEMEVLGANHFIYYWEVPARKR